MADTFINYEKQCKDTQGHIKRIYVLPFVFYNETLIKSSGMYLTTFPASTLYKFECWGNYSQSTTTEKGAVQWSHNIEVNLPKVYTVYDVNIFYRNEFRILAETNNGDLIMFGTNNGLACNITNNSGQSKGEFNGFTLTFDGIEEKPGLLIAEEDPFDGENPSLPFQVNSKICRNIETDTLHPILSHTVTVVFNVAFLEIPSGVGNLKVYRIIAEEDYFITEDVLFGFPSTNWLTLTGFTILINSMESLTGVYVDYTFIEQL